MPITSPSASAVGNIIFWADGEEGTREQQSLAKGDEDSQEGSSMGGESMYVTLFEDMIKTVLRHEANLFVREEMECFLRYTSLSSNARYLLVRLCLRKIEKWHRLSTLKYEQELGQGIPDAIRELCRDIPQQPSSTELKPVIKKEEPEVIDLTLDDASQPAPSQLASLSQASSSTSPEPDYSFFADDDSKATLHELLGCLTLEELRGIARQMKVKASSNRAQIVETLILKSSTQTTLHFPVVSKRNLEEPKLLQSLPPTTSGKKLTLQSRLRAMVMQTLGHCVKVNEDIIKLFRRLNLVYFRSTQYTPELLTPSILSRAQRRMYATYEYTRTTGIWPNRDLLLAYEESLELEARVDDLFEGAGSQSRSRSQSAASRTPGPRMTSRAFSTPGKGNRDTVSPLKRNAESLKGEDEYVPEVEVVDSPRIQAARAVVDIFEWVLPRWGDLLEIKDDETRPRALQRFDHGHILTRVVCKGAYALGILRDYSRELETLETLLAQKRWRRGRRGRWHERRALILMKHMKKDRETYERAMAAVIAGLEDEDTHIVFRPMLERRLTTLENMLKIPKEQRHVCEGGLSKAQDVFIEGSRIKHAAGALVLDKNLKPVGRSQAQVSSLTQAGGSTQPFFPRVSGVVDEKLGIRKEKSTGKSIWVGRQGEEVSVENLALQHYEDNGFKGFHCEGRIVTTLFGLLFWEIIFAPIPGAFETPYQSAPLDIAEDTFYLARQELVDERLHVIKNGGALQVLMRVLEEHSENGTWCVGVRWDLFQKQDLLEIAECLGGDGLEVICRLLCEDYAGRCSGVPDLIVWNAVSKECKFVEVKGPGDTLQENQKVWIDVLMRAGVGVEVCRVDEKGSAKSNKTAKGKGKGTTKSGKVGRPRTRKARFVETDEEEVDQLEESGGEPDFSQMDLKDPEDEKPQVAPRASPEAKQEVPQKAPKRVKIAVPPYPHKRRRVESNASPDSVF